MNKRFHAYYSGSVHGVGFRYTALRIAVSLNLTGWVKNLKCGRVETVCEGKEADLEAFAQKIDDIFGGYIRDKDADWSEATNEFERFAIRF
jgi:acylphosphatase